MDETTMNGPAPELTREAVIVNFNAVAGGWEEPVPLDVATVAHWPDYLLPEVIGDFAKAVADSTETPLELAMNDILGVLATAAQRKYEVMLKPDYREPLSYWGLSIQPPASRKSRVKAHTTAPLAEWEMERRLELQDAIRDASSQRKTEQKVIEGMRTKAIKIKDPQERREYIKDIADLEANLTEVPTLPRLWTDDITPERLSSLMAENHERMGIFSAEGGVFGIMAGRYSNGSPNLNIFLKAHAGDSERVDRGSREPVWLNNPALSMGLAVQPEVLRGLTQKREFRGYGLLARFAYAMPLPRLGGRNLETSSVNAGLELAYSGRVKAILNRDWNIDPVTDKSIPYVIKLSDDAWKAFSSFWYSIERELPADKELGHIQDWAGKLPGLVARVAGLVHVARHATVEPEKHRITLEDMTNAILWGQAVKSHALAAFDFMGADADLEGARHVLHWVRRKGGTQFTRRDCHNGNQRRFNKVALLDPALGVLEERGYIRRKLVEGTASVVYEVNPLCKN